MPKSKSPAKKVQATQKSKSPVQKAKAPAKQIKASQDTVSSQNTASSSQKATAKPSMSPKAKQAAKQIQMLKKIVEEESKNSKSPRAQNRSKSANSSKSKSPTVIISKPILKKRQKKDNIDLSNQMEVPPKFNVEQSSSFDVQLTGSTKPKMPKTSFIFYSMEYSPKIREKNPDLKMTEVTKLVGQSWGQISLKEKQKYETLAIQDKQRYAKEKIHLDEHGFFINEKGENSKDLFKPIIGDDVVKPKKPSSSYLFFCNEHQKLLREQNKDLAITETAKLTGLAWNKFTDKQKAPYQAKAQEDVIRHDREMKQLLSQGFFINKDGIKSTDLKTTKKRGIAAISSTAGDLSPSGSKRKAMTEPAPPKEDAIAKKSPKAKRVKK